MSASPAQDSGIEVVEFTDPACIWSWSSSPKYRWLYTHLADKVRWRRVFGIAYGDMASSNPGFDPIGSIPGVIDGWVSVVAETDAPLRRDPEWIFTSSRLMATAAKAAEIQGRDVADRVLRRLREAVFVVGRSADTPARLEAALVGVEGLDIARLLVDLDSPELRDAIAADWSETRAPHPDVLSLEGPGAARQDGEHTRYSFPTMLISDSTRTVVVPGWRPLEAYLAAFASFDPALREAVGPTISADDALDSFGTLTDVELRLFTGADAPPRAAVAISTPSGSLWVRPEDVAERRIEELASV